MAGAEVGEEFGLERRVWAQLALPWVEVQWGAVMRFIERDAKGRGLGARLLSFVK